jgi:hypothetical protein
MRMATVVMIPAYERYLAECEAQMGDSFIFDPDCARVIYENDHMWLILYTEGHNVLNVVYKDPEIGMESVELAF